MNALVTGGAGFIGSHLVKRLLDLDHDVTVLDDLSTGRMENLSENCRLVVGDVREAGCVRSCVAGKDTVFHLAAFTSVAGSIEDPDTCFDVNVTGTENLLQQACLAGVRRVVFSSTSAVYPEHPDTPRAEDTLPDPKSPYAQSKLEGESLLRQYQQREGLSWTALRYFNVYGPSQDAQSDYAAVIPAFLSATLKNEPLTIHGDGQQTRDFVYVEDVVEANLLASASKECGIFNVGTSCPVSILCLAKTVIQLEGSKAGYTFAGPRPGDVLSSTADISQISARLKWAPRWNLNGGLKETSPWFKSRRCGTEQ